MSTGRRTSNHQRKATCKMIDEDHYVFPHEEPKRERTKEELEASRKLEDELYALGFRPIGVEW